MTRILFWILLLANAVLFATMQWGSQLWSESLVIQPELNGAKVRLLNAEQIALTEKSLAQTHASAAAANPTNMRLALDTTAPLVDQSSIPICLEWGEFLDTDLKQVKAALSALELGDKFAKRQVEHTIGYWVFIPPLKDKAAINKKIEQLKESGVPEYFIVQEAGAWRNAISLGVFKTQEAAQNYLITLRTKQIQSAQVGKRNSKFKLNVLMLNEVNALTEAKLIALQKDFVGSELKNVPCRLTR